MLKRQTKIFLLLQVWLTGVLLPCAWAENTNSPSGDASLSGEKQVARIQPQGPTQGPRGRMVQDPLAKMSVFKDFSVRNFFDGDVVDVSEEKEKTKAPAAEADAKLKAGKVEQAPSPTPTQEPTPGLANPLAMKLKKPGPIFVGAFKPEDLGSPDETPRTRINPEAPAPFVGMALSYQEGDMETANKYADQLVRYEQQMIFEVRDLAEMVGQALIRQNAIKEDDWSGVQQYLEYQSAVNEEEAGSLSRPTHENSLLRIKPDTRGRADIYFFFDLSSNYCRYMTPDMERLWKVVKNDPSVRMTGVTMGNVPDGWIEGFRAYTGATFPIHDGSQAAKAFHVKLLPAVVVLSPTTNKAYIKTGQSSFVRLYEFVRRVQGLPASISPELERIINTPIGDDELKRQKDGKWKIAKLSSGEKGDLRAQRVAVPKIEKTKQVMVERF